jgi:hypothetical protein
MKKLLILAYDFPPYVSVGGLRPLNWHRHLKEFDVEPVVITRQWSNTNGNHLDYISPGISPLVVEDKSEFGTIFRTPYHPNLSNRLLLKYGDSRFKVIRKLISGYYEFTQFLAPTGPKSGLYNFAREYLKENKVDAIIATGDPFVLFSYASKLSKEFGIPWIADYRDPWSQNFSSKKGYFQRKLDLFFEKKIVKSCSKIITVDALFKLKIGQLFPQKAFDILPNGFDEEQIASCSRIEQNSKQLTFSFIGTIYNWHPLELILNDFSNFAKMHPEKPFILKFYGTNCPERIEELVESNYSDLKNKTIILNKLPNGQLLQSLAKDNVLLLFNYYNFTGTKIYDYLGLKRKIILCYSDSAEAQILKEQYYFHSIETDVLPQIEIIKETNSGVIVKDSEHLIEVLEELYKEFSETGQISCNSMGIEKYSRKLQVEKLAYLIQNLSPTFENKN